MRHLLLCVPLISLAACETVREEIGANVIDSSAAEVAGCTNLGSVRAIPKIFGPLKRVGLEDGKRAARAEASKAGANRIVFDPISPDADVFVVTGTAYRC